MQFELFWNIHECTYKSKLVESVYNSHPGNPRNHLLRARSPSLVMLWLPVSSSAWLVFNCFCCSLANHSTPFSHWTLVLSLTSPWHHHHHHHHHWKCCISLLSFLLPLQEKPIVANILFCQSVVGSTAEERNCNEIISHWLFDALLT